MSKRKIYNLTEREKEVLNLLLKGHSNTKMAQLLSISVHTIKAHIESIYRKFGVHSKVQAAIFAVINELVNVDDYIN